jgi:hypothetical protein
LPTQIVEKEGHAVETKQRILKTKAGFSFEDLSENQTETGFNERDKEQKIFDEKSSSEILRIYLNSLGRLKRRKQYRCISQKLHRQTHL